MEMDISKIISIAKQNVNEGKHGKNTGYSTQLKGPQKLGKNVNPKAIKAFLNRKKEDEKKQVVDQKVKKKELTKLREEKKTSGKARAMASRTKDNLLGYRGEDCLGLYKEKRGKNDPILTPDEEKRHRAFMNKISRIPTPKDFEEKERQPSENDIRRQRKMEKNRKRARSEASGLNFTELISLAENKKKKQSSDEESSANSDSDSSDSDGNLTAQERFERERRKRKALEAKLKSQNGLKRKSDGSSNFKVAKLSKGMTEVDKQEKIKALMAKFKSKKAEPGDSKTSLPNRSGKFRKPENGKRANTNSFSKASKDNKVSLSKPLDKRKKGEVLKATTSKQSPKPDNKPQVKTNPYMSELKKKRDAQRMKEEAVKRKQSNGYNDLMEKAKGNTKLKTQCTLSVTSSGVRTNYPGVAEPNPRGVKVYGNSAMDGNKRRAMEILGRRGHNGNRPTHPMMHRPAPSRPQVFEDEDDDEYDSDMEGFIDDDDEYGNPNITAVIGKMFGYDKSKYGRESEYELSKMDASFRDIQQEESRSLRIARKEDALEAKLEEERLKRKKAKKR